MKKKICSLLLIILCFCSCERSTPIMNYKSDDYITLYDYHSISIEKDFTEITDEEIIRIIETEMSVNEAYIEITDRKNIKKEDIVSILVDNNQEYYFMGSDSYPENFDEEILKMSIGEIKRIDLSNAVSANVKLLGIYRLTTIKDEDFILKYYNYDNITDLKNFIKERARQEIIFNHSYDIVYEKSMLLDFPIEIRAQINRDTELYRNNILQYYSDFNEFLSENNTTEDEFTNHISDYYYEIMIYKAILEKEKINITEEEISKYKNENQTETYTDYDIYAELAYPKVREILISKTQILD